MAITAAIRSDIIELSVLATNQATGTVKLGALVADYEKSGMTGVGASITGTAAWKAKYPSFQTPEEFGKEFLEAIVPGLSAAALAEGVTIVAGLLNSGSTQADVLIASSDFLSNASVTDATFGDYAAKFQNQAAVAEFHTITQELNTELVLTNITSDAATVVTAKGELDGSTAAAAAAVVAADKVVADAAAKVITDAAAPADADTAVTAGAAANTAAATAIAAIVDTATANAALVSANAADAAATAATTATALYTTVAAATADAADDTAAATLATTAATQATTATGYVTSATAEVAIDRTASTFALTASLDLGAGFVGGAGDDTYSSVETAVTVPATDTFTTGDSIDGGAGIDTLLVSIAGAPNPASTAGVATANVEKLSIYNNSTTGTYTLDAAQMAGLTDLYVNGGSNDTIFTGIAGTPNLHLLSTSRSATVTATAASVLGTADSVTIASSASALTAATSATYNGIETVNLSIGGVTGTAANALTIASADLESIVVTGSSTANLVASFPGAVAGTQTSTFDASAATGNIVAALTRGASPASAVTMGAGDDRLDFLSTISEKDVLVGGAGTDILEIGGTNDWGKTAITQDNLSGISGFETLRLKAAGLVDARVLSGNTAITNVEFEGTGTYTDSAVTDAKSLASGTVTLDLATDSATDTLNYTSAGLGAITSTLLALDMETVNVTTGGAGNTALTIAAAAATSATAGTTIGVNDLTTVVATGTQSLNLTSSGKSTASVNAAGLTGLGEAFTLNAGTSTVAMTVVPSGFTPTTALSDTVNTITTGTGADTLTGTAFIDVLSGGTGNDTITGGGGVDTLNGGAGNDSITGGATTDTINDGTGNDVVVAGGGIDTLNIGTGSDNIDGGAGNDVINAGSNLTSGDTISGGADTDTLTANINSIGMAPTISAVENLKLSFGASTFLDFTNITGTTAVTVESGTTGAPGATLKALSTGATLKISDDLTTAGIAGDIGAIIVDTVADAGVTINLAANANSATVPTATTLSSLAFTDAKTVTINSTGGTVASPVVNDTTSLALDNADTTSLTISAAANTAVDVGNLTLGAKLETLSVTAAAAGDAIVGSLITATGLQSITLVSSGVGADLTLAAIGATGNSLAMQTISMTASGGGTITPQLVTSKTSNLDTFTVSATGINSSVIPGGAFTTTNSSINAVNISVADRAVVTMSAGDLTIGSGAISALAISATGRGAMDLTGFDVQSTSTLAVGNYSISTGTRGSIVMDTNTVIAHDGNIAKLSVIAGADSTFNWTDGKIKTTGTIASTVVTVGADAVTSGTLTIGEATTTMTDVVVTKSIDADNSGDVDLVAATITKLTVNQVNETGNMTLTGTRASNNIALSFDNGGADNLTTTVGTALSELVLNASGSTGNNNLDAGAAGKANITSGSGADTINGGAGADTINAGGGIDEIYPDSGGVREIQSITIATNAASGGSTDTMVLNGVTIQNVAAANATPAAQSAAYLITINANAALDNILVASAGGTGVIILTWLVDGNQATTPAVTIGTAGSTYAIATGTTGTTVGNGINVITGGAGADTIVFGGATGTGGSGAAASATVFTTITDYATGVDKLDFTKAITLVAEGTSAVAQAVISATGLATFNAGTADTLAAKLVAVEAGMSAATNTAGEAAVFIAAASTYLLVSDGVSGLSANDQLIKLTGVTAATGIVVTSGDITAIA